jgi:tetratricopeptide (TPR) repeat protein
MRIPLQLHHRTLRRSLLIVIASALTACGQPAAAPPPAAAPTALAAPRPTTPPRPTASPMPTTAPTSAPPSPTAEAITAARRQAIALSAEGWRRERLFADLDGAVAHYTAAIEADPTYAEAWLHRAIVVTRLTPPQDAGPDLAQGMRLRPPAYLADYYRARLTDDYADKLTFYGRALAAKPDFAQGWLSRGIAHYVHDDYAEAAHDFTEALRLDPSLAEAWYYRGGLADIDARPADAQAAYDQALTLVSAYPLALTARGRLRMYQLADTDGGLADLAASAALTPDRGEAWCRLGQAYLYSGDAAQAVVSFTTSIDVDSAYICAYFHRARALLALDRPQEALIDSTYYVSRLQSADGWLLRSLIYERLGDLDGALSDAGVTIANYPDVPQGYERRGDVLLALGRDAEALEDYTAAIERYRRAGLEEQAAALIARVKQLGLTLSA